MKKLMVSVSLIFCLVLLTAGGTQAAVHNFTGDFRTSNLLSDFGEAGMPTFEGWYYIEKDSPTTTLRGAFGEGPALGAEYYKNDQTFADFYYTDPDGGKSETYLKGSYLFANHFFAGIEVGSPDDNTQMVLSPGYRYDFNDNCYIAGSLDYATSNDIKFKKYGVAYLDFNWRYYNDVSRAYSQLVIPRDEVVGTDDCFFLFGGAYKYSGKVVLGANIVRQGDYDYYEFGCTTVFDKLGAELRYISDDGAATIDGNLLYSFTNTIRAGFEVKDVEDVDDPYLIIKGKYTVDKRNAAVFMYQFENGDDSGIFYLRWDINY